MGDDELAAMINLHGIKYPSLARMDILLVFLDGSTGIAWRGKCGEGVEARAEIKNDGVGLWPADHCGQESKRRTIWRHAIGHGNGGISRQI